MAYNSIYRSWALNFPYITYIEYIIRDVIEHAFCFFYQLYSRGDLIYLNVLWSTVYNMRAVSSKIICHDRAFKKKSLSKVFKLSDFKYGWNMYLNNTIYFMS